MKIAGVSVGLVELVVAGVVIVAAVKFSKGAGAVVEGAKDLAEQINPVNPNNIVARQFQKVYGGGWDGHGTLGTDIYEFFHRGE